jgi:hypothetical protein
MYFGLQISEAVSEKPLEPIFRADTKFLQIIHTELYGVKSHTTVILTFTVFRASNFNIICDSTLK